VIPIGASQDEFLEIQRSRNKVSYNFNMYLNYKDGYPLSSYLQYSSICARLLRRVLKPELRDTAMRAEDTTVRVAHWKDGKMGKPSKFRQVTCLCIAVHTSPVESITQQQQVG